MQLRFHDSVAKSELLTPITLEVGSMENGYVTGMQYFLATVEAFERSATIVPNIGRTGAPKSSHNSGLAVLNELDTY